MLADLGLDTVPALSMPDESVPVALLYIFLGLFGFISNAIVVAMVLSVSAYHKSAYFLMANIAVADAIQSLIIGCYTGYVLLAHALSEHHRQIVLPKKSASDTENAGEAIEFANQTVCLISITAWFVMIYTYGILGVNRCVSTCFYKTKLRRFNRLQYTRYMIVFVWIVSLSGGITASFPQPIIVVQIHIWTMRFINTNARSQVFILFNITINAGSIVLQWICSGFVLNTVRKIHKRISTHSMSTAKIRRSQKQMRLSFQFFYPSVVCTLSSIMFFSMPLYAHLMTRWHFLISHLVWLINHLCNPLIYLYFNGRMRETISLWLKCERDNGNSQIDKCRGTTAYGYSIATADRRSTKDLTTVMRSSTSFAVGSSGSKKFSLPSLRLHSINRSHRASRVQREEETIKIPAEQVDLVERNSSRKMTA